MEKIKLMVVDDHQILRDGIKLMVNKMKNIHLVGEASNGAEFLDLLPTLNPDVVLMDINMPVINGIEATQKALAIFPNLKILVLSMYNDYNYYNTMIELGVRGFLLKESGYHELEIAIEAIVEGKHFFSQDLLLNIIKGENNQSQAKLTSREKEVLSFICKGLSTHEIAEKLFLSPSTVEKHRSDLLLKTGSHNSISLVVYAIKNNMVSI